MWVVHVCVGGPCLCEWVSILVGGPHFVGGPRLCGLVTSLVPLKTEWAPSGVKASFPEFLCVLEKVSGLNVNVGIKIGGRKSAAWAQRGGQSAIVLRDLRGQRLPGGPLEEAPGPLGVGGERCLRLAGALGFWKLELTEAHRIRELTPGSRFTSLDNNAVPRYL